MIARLRKRRWVRLALWILLMFVGVVLMALSFWLPSLGVDASAAPGPRQAASATPSPGLIVRTARYSLPTDTWGTQTQTTNTPFVSETPYP